MTCEERERMAELCRLIQDEKDSTRFDQLIEEPGMLLGHSERADLLAKSRVDSGKPGKPGSCESGLFLLCHPEFRMECEAA